MNFKIGSLFDGSGGFPLAAVLCDGEPVWASEVEPYPIAVTQSRFPKMKHLGDISKVNGADIEPVDLITFGSPCQDLSVAGKRAGLKHETNGDEETTRSGLFMEAVRIIKEMREATNGEYPRFALWENVPGAFSSNKGEDFKIVLQELIQIVEPCAEVPPPLKGGWPYSDVYMGNGWSLAYRTFDAQYWGVPQRRRRIHLVCDFRGKCAHEILFKRESLRGYFAESRTPWQGTAAYVKDCIGAAGFCPEQSAKTRGIGYQEEIAPSLRAGVTPAIVAVENHPADSRVKMDESGTIQTLTSRMGTGGGNVPLRLEPRPYTLQMRSGCEGGGKGPLSQEDKSATLTAANGQYLFQPTAGVPTYCLQGNGIDRADTAGCNGKGWREDKCYTLNTIDRPAVVYPVAYDLDRASFNQGKNALFNFSILEEQQPTLTAKGPGAVCQATNIFGKTKAGSLLARDYKGICRYDTLSKVVAVRDTGRYIIRRLTPTECARLQGFPDKWGEIDQKTDFSDEEYRFWLEVRNTHAAINGKTVKDYTKEQTVKWYNKLHTDSAEYKMWGNGIALPPALYVMQGIMDAIEEDDSWME